jgi:hypothetical protein
MDVYPAASLHLNRLLSGMTDIPVPDPKPDGLRPTHSGLSISITQDIRIEHGPLSRLRVSVPKI